MSSANATQHNVKAADDINALQFRISELERKISESRMAQSHADAKCVQLSSEFNTKIGILTKERDDFKSRCEIVSEIVEITSGISRNLSSFVSDSRHGIFPYEPFCKDGNIKKLQFMEMSSFDPNNTPICQFLSKFGVFLSSSLNAYHTLHNRISDSSPEHTLHQQPSSVTVSSLLNEHESFQEIQGLKEKNLELEKQLNERLKKEDTLSKEVFALKLTLEDRHLECEAIGLELAGLQEEHAETLAELGTLRHSDDSTRALLLSEKLKTSHHIDNNDNNLRLEHTKSEEPEIFRLDYDNIKRQFDELSRVHANCILYAQNNEDRMKALKDSDRLIDGDAEEDDNILEKHLEKKVLELEDLVHKVKNEKEDISNKFEREIIELKQTLDEMSVTSRNLEKSNLELLDTLDEMSTELVKLRTISAESSAVLSLKKKENVIQESKKVNELETYIVELQQKLQELNKEYDVSKLTSKELSDSFAKLESELADKCHQLSSTRSALASLSAAIEDSNNESERLQQSLQSKLAVTQRELVALKRDAAGHSNAIKDLEISALALSTAELRIRELESECFKLKGDITILQTGMEKLLVKVHENADVREYFIDKRIMQTALRAFAKADKEIPGSSGKTRHQEALTIVCDLVDLEEDEKQYLFGVGQKQTTERGIGLADQFFDFLNSEVS